MPLNSNKIAKFLRYFVKQTKRLKMNFCAQNPNDYQISKGDYIRPIYDDDIKHDRMLKMEARIKYITATFGYSTIFILYVFILNILSNY